MSMKDQISRITRLTELAGDAEGLAEMMAALKKMATIEDDTAAAEKRSGELKKMCAEEHAKLDGILADLATARAAGKLAAEEAAAKVKQAIKDANQEAERIAGEASVKAQGIIDQAERSAMAGAETGRCQCSSAGSARFSSFRSGQGGFGCPDPARGAEGHGRCHRRSQGRTQSHQCRACRGEGKARDQGVVHAAGS